MQSAGFDGPGFQPPATLPAMFEEAAGLTRPVLTAGSEPRAVVLLVEVDAKGLASS
ncbi:hypothetical protein GXW78_07510 [Roseomonas terrae]|uniref:Uncharacterized protein n=1 Tax=Neoroseomonas terrae TaxID=424799 RepID=A0ABS5EEQ4_9PROT|nr:hypothetical protein [Neoroseomonas terrae]MBR0649501.1 hypothetical protein [Neoroseomonas terrae]